MRVVTIAVVAGVIGGFIGASGSSDFSIPIAIISGAATLSFFVILSKITPQHFYDSSNDKYQSNNDMPLAIRNVFREINEKFSNHAEQKQRKNIENLGGLNARLKYEYRYFFEIMELSTYKLFLLNRMSNQTAGEYIEESAEGQLYLLGFHEAILDAYLSVLDRLGVGHGNMKISEKIKILEFSYKTIFGEDDGEYLYDISTGNDASNFFFTLGYEDGFNYVSKNINPMGFKRIIEN